MKKYKVTLTEEERKDLEHLISRGKGAARKLLHARILLKADETVGWTDEAISEALEVVCRLRAVRDGLLKKVGSGVGAKSTEPSLSTAVGWRARGPSGGVSMQSAA
jgi:hypothetical protein